MIKSEYTEQRDRHQKTINDFLSKYAFFAFDLDQYREGLDRLQIRKDDAVQFVLAGT